MENKRSKGVTIIGRGLYLINVFSLFFSLMYAPYKGFIALIWIVDISVFFFLLARGVLQLKSYARRFALIFAVPYLMVIMPLLLSTKLKVEAISFYASHGSQPLPVSADILVPGYSMGLVLCCVSVILGGVLLVFFTRPNVKEQFK